jgi:hypothetical protein
MALRAMHCLLPSCPKKLPPIRRIRGFWYCSELHFKRDRRRRGVERQADQDVHNPMRCGHCNQRIPWWRRIFAWEFCCRRCFREHGAMPRPRPYPEPTVEFIQGDRHLKLPRKEFLYISGAALVTGLIPRFVNQTPRNLPEGDAPTLPASYHAAFDIWTAEELKMWIQNSPSGPACRLDNGGLQILSTILLGTVTQAIAGSLQFRLSLNDSGSAKFVLGSDSLGERCVVVELLSKPLTLTLRAWHQKADGVAPAGGIRTLARNNKNAHDVTIAFSGSTIAAKVNGERMDWTGVRIEPGHVGLMGKEQDGFRVYRAVVALRT